MRGIVVDDFELVLKQNDILFETLKEDAMEYKISCSNVRKCIHGEEINFLVNNIYQDLNNINIPIKMINNFQQILRNVLNGYKNQEFEIAKTIRQKSL